MTNRGGRPNRFSRNLLAETIWSRLAKRGHDRGLFVICHALGNERRTVGGLGKSSERAALSEIGPPRRSSEINRVIG